MKIYFLGTGTSQGMPVIGCTCTACTSTDPRDNRLRTSIHVEGPDYHIQVDTGPDFRQQMLINKISEVDLVVYTHEHNDHVAGIDDVRPYNFKSGLPLNIYGLERVIQDIRERNDYIFKFNPYPGAPRVETFIIDENSRIEIGSMTIQPINILHGHIEILGYRFGNAAYLTDVKEIPEKSLGKLQGLDCLIISALRDKPHHSHLTLDDAIQYAELINAKSTYFVHMSHDLGPVKQWQPRLPKGMYAAYDGLVLEL